LLAGTYFSDSTSLLHAQGRVVANFSLLSAERMRDIGADSSVVNGAGGLSMSLLFSIAVDICDRVAYVVADLQPQLIPPSEALLPRSVYVSRFLAAVDAAFDLEVRQFWRAMGSIKTTLAAWAPRFPDPQLSALLEAAGGGAASASASSPSLLSAMQMLSSNLTAVMAALHNSPTQWFYLTAGDGMNSFPSQLFLAWRSVYGSLSQQIALSAYPFYFPTCKSPRCTYFQQQSALQSLLDALAATAGVAGLLLIAFRFVWTHWERIREIRNAAATTPGVEMSTRAMAHPGAGSASSL
jgi:hypothetical protein